MRSVTMQLTDLAKNICTGELVLFLPRRIQQMQAHALEEGQQASLDWRQFLNLHFSVNEGIYCNPTTPQQSHA